MHDNTKLTYAQADAAGNTIEMTYYADRDGTKQVNAGDSSTRVRSFTIHVKAGDDQNPVRSISVTGIPTHEERDDVPTGEVWTYKNTIHIDGVNGKASAQRHLPQLQAALKNGRRPNNEQRRRDLVI